MTTAGIFGLIVGTIFLFVQLCVLAIVVKVHTGKSLFRALHDLFFESKS